MFLIHVYQTYKDIMGSSNISCIRGILGFSYILHKAHSIGF